MKLIWKPSLRASALNLARQSILQPELSSLCTSDSFRQLAEDFHECARLIDIHDARTAWYDLIASSEAFARPDDHIRHWTSRIPKENAGSELRVSASQLQKLETEFREAVPQAESQMSFRLGPITQQWDGYGSALMAHLKRLVGLPIPRHNVDVLSLYPVINGDGFASLLEKKAVIEAVFVNPNPELPEVLRVTWLIAQIINAKAPTNAIEAKRHRDVSALALLPPVLAVGEVVELTRCDESTLQLAIDQFSPARPEAPDLSSILLHWWETFLQTKPEWPIGLRALERALDSRIERN
jgi:hypothetical protein